MTRIAVTAALYVFAAASAFAAPASPGPAAKHGGAACFNEVNRFCADVPFGGGKRIACLAQHNKELSADCKNRLAFMQQVFDMSQKQLQDNKKLQAKKAAAQQKAAASQVKPANAPAKPATTK
jgi:hypothetical protein